MTDYYPDKTVIQEADYLRAKLALKMRKYCEAGIVNFPTLLRNWTSSTYDQYDAVLYNGEVYRVAPSEGISGSTPPQNDGNPWFKVDENEWPAYVSGKVYNKGDRVMYTAGSATTPVKIVSTDESFTETASSARATYFVSKVDNNTSIPTSERKWARVYAYRPIYLTPRPL